MNQEEQGVDQVVRALLYEGYLLFPYRPSSRKNQVRWNFGCVMPPLFASEHGGSERAEVKVQCLLQTGASCRVSVEVRCLQLVEHAGLGREPWQEAEERSLTTGSLPCSSLASGPLVLDLNLPGGEEGDGRGGMRTWLPLTGRITFTAEKVGVADARITVTVANVTEVEAGLSRSKAVERALVSAHAILGVTGGEFYSLTDPPKELASAAAECRNVGLWPVLVGGPGARDTVLASPIILEDYPRVAAESPGDLFDATEVDELLSLNILSLTEEEKEEIRQGDEVGRRLLERTEALDQESLLRLHGSGRSLVPNRELTR